MRYFPFDSVVTYEGTEAIYDREANSDQLADWLAHYFTNGVFKDSSGTPGFGVTADGSGMNVSVLPGAAQINGRFCSDTASFPLSLQSVGALYGRIDLVVLRLNLETEARNISLQIIQGDAAASPVAKYSDVKRTSSIYDLVLAEINIPAGSANVTQSMIADMRTQTFKRTDNSEAEQCCGIVECPLTSFDISDLYRTYQNSINTWFNSVKGLLDSDDTTGLVSAVQSLMDTVNGIDGVDEGLVTKLENAVSAMNASVNASFSLTTLWEGNGQMLLAGNGCLRQSIVDRDTAAAYDAALIVFRKSTNNSEGLYLYKSYSAPKTNILGKKITNDDFDRTCTLLIRKGEKSQVFMTDSLGRKFTRPVWWMTEDWQDYCTGTTATNTMKPVSEITDSETKMGAPFTGAFYFGDARFAAASNAFTAPALYYKYVKKTKTFADAPDNQKKNNDYNQFLVPMTIYGVKFTSNS